MPYDNPKINIAEGTRSIRFSYECWKNHQGEGIVSVKGNTGADHLELLNNRTDIADLIKYNENLDKMRYFEDQQNGRHTEVQLTTDEGGRVTDTLRAASSLSTRELREQGQKLLDQEHEHMTNLAVQEFGDQAKNFRNNPGHGFD